MSKWFYITKITVKSKKLGFHSCKHSTIPVELWDSKLAPGLSSIQYLLSTLTLNYYLWHLSPCITKLLLSFSIAHVCRMFQFQTLIRLRDSPLQRKSLIFVVFIDATIDPLCKLLFWTTFWYLSRLVCIFVFNSSWNFAFEFQLKETKNSCGNWSMSLQV